MVWNNQRSQFVNLKNQHQKKNSSIKNRYRHTKEEKKHGGRKFFQVFKKLIFFYEKKELQNNLVYKKINTNYESFNFQKKSINERLSKVTRKIGRLKDLFIYSPKFTD